jgi:hypothetical protein
MWRLSSRDPARRSATSFSICSHRWLQSLFDLALGPVADAGLPRRSRKERSLLSAYPDVVDPVVRRATCDQ